MSELDDLLKVKLDDLFKFKIGQVVCHVATTGPHDLWPAEWAEQAADWQEKLNLQINEATAKQPAHFFILERILQQCPGGVQLHYRCRPYGRSGLERVVNSRIFELNEIELKEV